MKNQNYISNLQNMSRGFSSLLKFPVVSVIQCFCQKGYIYTVSVYSIAHHHDSHSAIFHWKYYFCFSGKLAPYLENCVFLGSILTILTISFER